MNQPLQTPPQDPEVRDDGVITGLRLGKLVTWLVYAYLVIAVVILVLAFFLMLFNASTTAEFTQWVYRSADRVLQPFRGIFPTAQLGEQGSVIDFAVLFAIIMYGIFAMIISTLVSWLDRKIDEHRRALAAGAARDRHQAAQPASQSSGYPQTTTDQPRPAG
jgi:uncharacterized protein YggT (Ycf19 family)